MIYKKQLQNTNNKNCETMVDNSPLRFGVVSDIPLEYRKLQYYIAC